MNKKKGFTVIELIIVIIIIGILAKLAIPRFIDQTTAAKQNSTNALAAALAAASAENFAKRSANSALGSAITNCQQISALLSGGALPLQANGQASLYTITSLSIAAGASAVCTLNGPSGTTAVNFTGLGIS